MLSCLPAHLRLPAAWRHPVVRPDSDRQLLAHLPVSAEPAGGSDRVAAITANFSPLPPSRINERLCNYPCPNVTMRPCALQKCIAI
ncbi:hypothetical protein D1220_30165 (plasmid) [Klebsiella pneumoniae]|nr:hypothetical protein D1220_30165 [Klebsiella pneumoniae]